MFHINRFTFNVDDYFCLKLFFVMKNNQVLKSFKTKKEAINYCLLVAMKYIEQAD